MVTVEFGAFGSVAVRFVRYLSGGADHHGSCKVRYVCTCLLRWSGADTGEVFKRRGTVRARVYEGGVRGDGGGGGQGGEGYVASGEGKMVSAMKFSKRCLCCHWCSRSQRRFHAPFSRQDGLTEWERERDESAVSGCTRWGTSLTVC